MALLRGVNWSGLEYRNLQGLSLSLLTKIKAQWNINIIRFCFNRADYLSNYGGAATTMRNVQSWCQSLGIIIIFDQQWEDVSNDGNMPNLPSQSGSVTLWTAMAKEPQYKNNPLVWFDIWNEPHNCTIVQWKTIASACVTAIRNAGANNICMIAGIDWAKDLASWHGTYLPQSNIIYSLHPYSYNANDPSISYLNTQLGTVLKDGQQIFVGELGTCPNGNCNISDSATIGNIKNLLFPWLDGKTRGTGIPTTQLGFTAWSMTASTPTLTLSDHLTPTAYGQVVKNELTSILPPPTSILTSISPASLTIQINHMQKFIALDQNKATITSGISWSRTGVGSINNTTNLGNYSSGTVAGTAVITAKQGTITKTANVTVVSQNTCISLTVTANL